MQKFLGVFWFFAAVLSGSLWGYTVLTGDLITLQGAAITVALAIALDKFFAYIWEKL